MTIQGVIFDFDGTLFDTMGIWETAGEDYLARLGLRGEYGLGETLKPMSMEQSARYLQQNYLPNLSLKEIMAGINETVEEFYLHRARPKAGVESLLADLRARKIPMCIATATDRYQVEGALRRCDLLHYFGEIFTCSQVEHGKDEPEIYQCARAFLGTEQRKTAVFEDAYHAAKTAKDAGFFVVGVYDPYEPRRDELKALVDVYVADLSQVGELLDI